MPISFESRGSFTNTEKYLQRLRHLELRHILEKYGQQGVAALAAATPVRTGLTASSWGYEVVRGIGGWTIAWTNSDRENGGFPVAVMIQYGHGTGTGGWVQGIDYINPAVRPIFEAMANDVWKEVKRV